MESDAQDSEIRARIAANDPAALELIWTAYASDLLGYLMALHGSRHEAEDTLQEVFVTMATKRAHLLQARHLKAYLFRLARNHALNRIKRDGRWRERHRFAGDWIEPEAADGDGETRARLLAEALARLPERQRAVVALKFFHDKTLREIGMLLGMSGNTAASCLRYGMEKLRGLLKGKEDMT